MKQQFKKISSIQAADEMLVDLGAPAHLIQYVKLVGEAAEILILQIQQLDLVFDRNWIRLGVAVHDVGKIWHPSELVEKGNRHESAGEILF